MNGIAEPRTGAVRFSVLGPLSVHLGGRALSLGPLKQRLLLAMLLCRPNKPVSVDALTDALWADMPPRTARKNLQVYVSALRKLLDDAGARDRLEHQAGGYVLRVGEDELDSLRFHRLVQSGRDALRHGAPVPAARLLREALDLWRGPALPELLCSRAVLDESERLNSRYLQLYEDWAEAELSLGNAPRIAETVADLVEQHPLRERLRAVQMNVLCRLGRQTEAFAAYEGLRQLLASELGLQPSPSLQALYRSMLDGCQDGTGAPPGPSSSVALPARGGLRSLLPRDPGDFTGRHDQVRELMTLFGQDSHAERRVAVLTGPVGMGKTETAVHVAHRLADAFPDGRLLVRMRDAAGVPRPWPAVLTELARLVGLARPVSGGAVPDGPDDPDETASVWRAWLAHRRLLLLLDDAAAEADVRPLLPDAGASAVMITARSQLGGLAPAHRVALAPFSMSEALDLLAGIIGPDRLRGDRGAAERIVAATGMLPLAVRVSGLKLAVLRHLPLGEYAARLADDSILLDELTAGDMDVRPRLSKCWSDLPEASRTVLRRLGTLPEPVFTLHEAATVLARGQDQARRELESLMDAGMIALPDSEVTAHAVLYELPRLLHVYARQQSLADAAGPRHAMA
ncbi:BTAD domain-containing putative transcriptional regulator [Streptomyces sp. NBC_00872]|uniref:AfsR/SARP family transcriptional regulator n=1 Tax=Streptomyces sp. NBC_00872 TaxID=2903686 RepID=UPI003863E4FA|nr:winged helix-turn-helix domain-containing protein [Streptomyces sp. NBC_00872]